MHALRHLHPPTGVVAQPTNHSPLYFGAQTKKLSRWFWGSSHQTTDTGFEAQTRKPEATSFEVKLWETVIVVLRPNHWQIVDLGFEAKLKAHAPRLLVHGTNHTQHHPISQSSSHWVPDLCLTIPNPLHQVCYSCHDPYHCPPCCTCHLHTTRQANAILHTKQRYTSRTIEMSQIRIQTSICKWLITYQTKVLITWLLNQQTVARFILGPKPRNCRGDFEAQVTKPQIPVLRPKPGNPKPPVLRSNCEKPS
jgi:hypothetical protein